LNQYIAKCDKSDKAIGYNRLIVESVSDTIGCNVQSVVLVTNRWIHGTIRAVKLGTTGSDGKRFSVVAKFSKLFSQLLDRGVNFSGQELGRSLFFDGFQMGFQLGGIARRCKFGEAIKWR
jgi:hypothetical protein